MEPVDQTLMPHHVKSCRCIKGYTIGISSLSERMTNIIKIGKDITGGFCLAKAILSIREKTLRFKMPEEMEVEKKLKAFGNGRSRAAGQTS